MSSREVAPCDCEERMRGKPYYREFACNNCGARYAMTRISPASTTPVVDNNLGANTNWPLCDVLTQLAEWAKHLHDDHDCDCHGWEARSFLIEAATNYAAATAAPELTDLQKSIIEHDDDMARLDRNRQS